MALESIVGLAIVAGFGIYLMRDFGKAKGTENDVVEESGVQDESAAALSTGDEWCFLIEEACACAAFCFDDSMRLVSCGERAKDLLKGSVDMGSHLIDIFPDSVSDEILRGAAQARRGETHSKAIVWNGDESRARFLPLGDAAIVICVDRGSS